MVAPGNVAVGRSGGVILGDATGFLATSAREFASANRITLIRWDHGPTSPNRTVTWSNGSIMRRAFVMAVASISLAGCSSFSTSSLNYFKSDPPTIQVQLSVTPPDGSTSFLVNYSMPGKQPAGVPVQIVKVPGGVFSSDTVKLSPNPVVADLQPIGPPPKPAKPMRPRRKKPAADPADAADPSAAPQR
jgi:hypothetical protein